MTMMSVSVCVCAHETGMDLLCLVDVFGTGTSRLPE